MKLKIIFYSVLLVTTTLGACSKEKKTEKAGEKMQEFIQQISSYSKSQNPNFLIIPQNGMELAFNNVSSDEELNYDFLNSIDGFGVEEMFFDDNNEEDAYRIEMAKKIAATGKTIMVSEYLKSNDLIPQAISKCEINNFLCFPRSSNNYDYKIIPSNVTNENTDDIEFLSQAKNYLYLISSSNYSSKQAFLNAIASTNFDLVLIDLFWEETPFTENEINQLKTKSNGGKRLVISYINVGAAEKYRYYWQDKWKLHSPHWLKKKYDGYDDEIYVKFWNKNWSEIIYGNDNSYMKKIIDAGFDGAYLDNVEVFYYLYNE